MDINTADGNQTYRDELVQQISRREPPKRVFVNRTLHMSKIKFFGFDMDYTLAGYKSPAFEVMSFQLIIERLISIGYPEDIRKFEYVPHFPVRGLWFDMEYGNLLKVDAYGNILVGVHGFHYMKPHEIEAQYPNKFLHLHESRVYVLNTLFNLPETYVLACMVDYYDHSEEYSKLPDSTGVVYGDVHLSYRSIFRDIRGAVDWIHTEGSMKARTVADMDKYVVKDDRLGEMLNRMRQNGKTFLLTNSGYQYTRDIMTFLLGADWTKFFDYVIVDARKPLWFAEGTVFREVDTTTGDLKIGVHAGLLRPNGVYSGGSCAVFTKLVKARGKDVLYIGDHIFGDVLRSKKSRGWRTFLVVPELEQELQVWAEDHPLFQRLQSLDLIMGEMYKDMDSASTDVPNVTRVTQAIRELTHQMDQSYGMLGSLFRSGNRTTFFASQAARYADLYAASCGNLLHYPFTYLFRAPPTLFPHESTINVQTLAPSESTALMMQYCRIGDNNKNGHDEASVTVEEALLPPDTPPPHDRNLRARTPKRPTFAQEEGGEDEREHSSTTPPQSNNTTGTPPNQPLRIDSDRNRPSDFDLQRLVSMTSSEDVIVMHQGESQ